MQRDSIQLLASQHAIKPMTHGSKITGVVMNAMARLWSKQNMTVFTFIGRNHIRNGGCPLLAHNGQTLSAVECPLLDKSGQNPILARDGLSANDP